VNDDELRALVEQAHQLEELTKHPGWAVLEDFALRRPGGSATMQSRIVNGNCESIDDYKLGVGYLKGIHYVIDAPQTVKRMATDERLRRAERVAEREEE
jgi:hypothetical protein